MKREVAVSGIIRDVLEAGRAEPLLASLAPLGCRHQAGFALDDVFGLCKKQEKVQELLRAFVAARAHRIWLETTPAQRKGFHSAGIGLSAGKFIDTNLEALITLLRQAEAAIAIGDEAGAGKAVVAFAELVFQTAPFQAPKPLPARWRDAPGLARREAVGRCSRTLR